jgi:hypothetical protein
MRSPPTLSTLPPEIILNVFKSADDFSDVAALARTAHIFNNVWKQNPNSICKAVLPRAITNLPAAEKLLEAQEKAGGVSSMQDDEKADGGDSTQDASCLKSINRAKLLLSNARWASAAASHWINWVTTFAVDVLGDSPVPPEVKLREAADFERALHRIWAVGYIMKLGNILQGLEFLATLNEQELMRVREVVWWCDLWSMILEGHWRNFASRTIASRTPTPTYVTKIGTQYSTMVSRLFTNT